MWTLVWIYWNTPKLSLNFSKLGSHHYGTVVVYSRRGSNRKWISIDINAYLSMKREAPSVFSRGVVHIFTKTIMTNLWKRREKILRKKDWTLDEKQLKLELADHASMVELLCNVFWIVFDCDWGFRTEKQIQSMWKKRVKKIVKEWWERI